MDLKKMTTKELKQEATTIDDLINCCSYGKSDLIILDSILNELEDRGVEISTKLDFN